MNREPIKEYREIADALEFQLRMSAVCNTSGIHLDRRHGYVLLEIIKERLCGGDNEQREAD